MVRRDWLQPWFWEGMRKARLEEMPPQLVKAYRETSPHPERLPSFFRKSVDRMLGFRDWPEHEAVVIARAGWLVPMVEAFLDEDGRR
jgi:hypothetical protein